MINNKIIYILGTFKYPYGEAASTRLTMLAKAIRHSGGNVSIVTCGKQQDDSQVGTRDEIPYTRLSSQFIPTACRFISALIRFLRAPYILTNWLDRKDLPAPDLVIVYGSSAWIGHRIIKWGHRNSVPVIFDIVEWYDVDHISGGHLSPFFYDSEVFMRSVSKKCNGVIAISHYLESYYKRDGFPVIRIPGIIDLSARDHAPSAGLSKGTFTVLYSGVPGKKDLLTPLLDAAKLLSDLGKDVRFVFTGRDVERALYRQGWDASRLGELDNVDFLGWLSEKDMEEVKANADAMVVFRTPCRSSLANFPQKFAEYMGSGRPVIVNNVGDMGIYIEHDVNGLICTDLTAKSVADAIQSLANRPDRGRTIGREAFATATKAFDFHAVSEPLSSFLGKIICTSSKQIHLR